MKHLKSFNESNNKAYKRSELTEDMFEKWIKNVRKQFGDDIHNSMDLIAMGIRALDDPKQTLEKKQQWRKNLWKYFENGLSHQNKLLCDKCGNPMKVYYEVHCFHCEKPEPKDNEMNYFQCVYWLENNEKEFSKDELWDYLLDCEIIQGNDTYCELPEITEDSNMKLFMKHFDTKTTKYFVSW